MNFETQKSYYTELEQLTEAQVLRFACDVALLVDTAVLEKYVDANRYDDVVKFLNDADVSIAKTKFKRKECGYRNVSECVSMAIVDADTKEEFLVGACIATALDCASDDCFASLVCDADAVTSYAQRLNITDAQIAALLPR